MRCVHAEGSLRRESCSWERLVGPGEAGRRQEPSAEDGPPPGGCEGSGETLGSAGR